MFPIAKRKKTDKKVEKKSQKTLRSSFTLLELLIVIAIIAILSAVVLVVINPSQLLKQARDSDRINDTTQLAKSINYLLIDTMGSLDMDGPYHSDTCKGETNQTIYTSLIDASSTTCQTLINEGELASPPSGWTYHCSTSTEVATKTNGLGWLPVNFTQAATLQLARLPLDPKNQSSNGLYYRYVCNADSQTFDISTIIESKKYQTQAENDGGVADNGYEKGTDLTLTPLTFPYNWIKVPGSSTYNTSDFWVMKYEAKYDKDGVGGGDEAGACRYNSSYNTWDWGASGSDCPSSWASSSVVSSAQGSPIAGITHDQALTACPPGSHLITNAEWMTIARNVEQIASNWSGGAVGSGCLFRGNVGSNDACGYDGANPEDGGGRNAKAKLTLSNGETIWDLSGNVWEHVNWTGDDGDSCSQLCQNNQPGSSGTCDDDDNTGCWFEFTTISDYRGLSYKDIRPSDSSWNANQGMGRIWSYGDGETGTTNRVLLRGGSWGAGSYAGAFALHLGWGTGTQADSVGFRCVRE